MTVWLGLVDDFILDTVSRLIEARGHNSSTLTPDHGYRLVASAAIRRTKGLVPLVPFIQPLKSYGKEEYIGNRQILSLL